MAESSSYDLEYLRIGLEEIEDYLLSKELFWPVTGRPAGGKPFNKMTIGNLLLSERRLVAHSKAGLLTAAEDRELVGMQGRLEAVQAKWRVNWEEKASQEYQTRFNQWMRALEELKSDRYQNAPYYRNEVRARVQMELLADHVPHNEQINLQAFDNLLKSIFKPGHFIWQAELSAGFSPDKFWYLYGSV